MIRLWRDITLIDKRGSDLFRVTHLGKQGIERKGDVAAENLESNTKKDPWPKGLASSHGSMK